MCVVCMQRGDDRRIASAGIQGIQIDVDGKIDSIGDENQEDNDYTKQERDELKPGAITSCDPPCSALFAAYLLLLEPVFFLKN